MLKKIKTEEPSLFKREMTALVFLAVSIFVLLALVSFYPQDPSLFHHSTNVKVQNWGGIVGAYLADTLVTLFGGGAYFIGGLCLLLSGLLFAGVRRQVQLLDIPVYFAFALFVAIYFHLSVGTLYIDGFDLEAGGIFGGLLGQMGVKFLGRSGIYLLVFFGTLVTFAWATHVSFKTISIKGIRLGTACATWAGRLMVIYWARLKKAISQYRDSIKNWWHEKRLRNDVKVIAKSQPQNTDKEVLSPSVDEGVEPRILERVDKKRKAKVNPQMEFQRLSAGYELPALNLLDFDGQQEEIPIDEMSLKMNARILEKKLMDFSVAGKVTEIHPGPVITMYEFQPAPGVKLSRIANLVDDLCLVMGGKNVRIVAPLPNKPAVGIEIPNNRRETVWLKDIIADEKFQKNESKLVLALGKDIEGIPFTADLAKMPHLLVAGATGAGKSVSINSMILSLLYKATPEEVRMIMVDPKMLELSLYEGIPHLLLPVVTHPKKAALALRWAVREMERRYRLLSDINARSIQNYNQKIEKGDFISKQKGVGIVEAGEEEFTHDKKLPYIVIIIDELADLMMVSSRDVEESITRLAQMARAAGIHLILATQRPSVDVLTGVIKANFPARISFKVSSKHDARTVLDTIGSERLLGQGDMLFIPPGVSQMVRVHGAFITESEVGRIVEFLKTQAKPVYNESILKPVETEVGEGEDGGGESDELYDQAVAIVAETKQASISMIQRKLRVGYNRAARMIEKMEVEGIVSSASGAGHRQVLVSSMDA